MREISQQYVEEFFDRAGGKRVGNNYKMECPFHDDKSRDSLHVSLDRPLWTCRVCSASGNVAQLADHLGMHMTAPRYEGDDQTNYPKPRPLQSSAAKKVKSDAEKLESVAHRGQVAGPAAQQEVTGFPEWAYGRMGRPAAAWAIRNLQGELIAHHVRFNDGNKKQVVWFRDGEWKLGEGIGSNDMPVYGYERVTGWLQDGRRALYVCEGEKATDALLHLGFAAVGTVGSKHTIPGEVLVEMAKFPEIVLLPDHDGIGKEHMMGVQADLERVDGDHRVYTLNLPGLPAKGDAYDWVATAADRGLSPEQTRDELVRLVKSMMDNVNLVGYGSAKESLEAIRAAMDNKQRGIQTWMPSGIQRFDEIFGGFRSGLFIVGGSPGAGKTTLLIQMCQAVVRAGFGVAYLSFDNTVHEIWHRVHATHLGTSIRDLEDGLISPEQLQQIEQKIEAEKAMYGRFLPKFGRRGWTFDDVTEMVEEVRNAQAPNVLVVIDYLQRAAKSKGGHHGKAPEGKEAIDQLLVELDEWSKMQGYPVVMPAALNREGAKGKVDLSAFSGSSEIEYVTKVGAFLKTHSDPNSVTHKLEDYYPRGQRPVWFEILKNRFGPLASIPLVLDEKKGVFSHDAERSNFMNLQKSGTPPMSQEIVGPMPYAAPAPTEFLPSTHAVARAEIGTHVPQPQEFDF